MNYDHDLNLIINNDMPRLSTSSKKNSNNQIDNNIMINKFNLKKTNKVKTLNLFEKEKLKKMKNKHQYHGLYFNYTSVFKKIKNNRDRNKNRIKNKKKNKNREINKFKKEKEREFERKNRVKENSASSSSAVITATAALTLNNSKNSVSVLEKKYKLSKLSKLSRDYKVKHKYWFLMKGTARFKNKIKQHRSSDSIRYAKSLQIYSFDSNISHFVLNTALAYLGNYYAMNLYTNSYMNNKVSSIRYKKENLKNINKTQIYNIPSVNDNFIKEKIYKNNLNKFNMFN